MSERSQEKEGQVKQNVYSIDPNKQSTQNRKNGTQLNEVQNSNEMVNKKNGKETKKKFSAPYIDEIKGVNRMRNE